MRTIRDGPEQSVRAESLAWTSFTMVHVVLAMRSFRRWLYGATTNLLSEQQENVRDILRDLATIYSLEEEVFLLLPSVPHYPVTLSISER